jgi:hypothetical protein
MNWEKGGALAQWLDGVLARSEAKFIFLASHWPAWTSGGHGRLNKDGRPRERPIRLAQDVIMPLLHTFNATAMFAGHDHFYERSEPDNGVTVIVTGGAGAPLRNRAGNAERQNPHSEVFKKAYHYCLLTIDEEEEECTMEVLTPEGTKIDSRSWAAREGRQE